MYYEQFKIKARKTAEEIAKSFDGIISRTAQENLMSIYYMDLIDAYASGLISASELHKEVCEEHNKK